MTLRMPAPAMPRGLTDPDLTKLLGDIARLQRETAAANRDLRSARVARRIADRQDTDAYATALREGRDDPGPVAAKTADERIIAAGRRANAARLARDRAQADLERLVRERRDVLTDPAIGQPFVVAATGAVSKATDAIATLIAWHEWRSWVTTGHGAGFDAGPNATALGAALATLRAVVEYDPEHPRRIAGERRTETFDAPSGFVRNIRAEADAREWRALVADDTAD